MRTITIFGGSGFVGRYLVQKFAEEGDLIRVAVRNPIAANFLKPLGEVGQITPIQASLLNEDEISRAIQGADVVINLVGILYEKGSQTFEAIHVEGARRVAGKTAEFGIPTLLHMSALGAHEDASSKYASSKARGEEGVLRHFPEATIFRPSVIFGAEDSFLNRFAKMALISPFLPLIGGGKTRFQPIYVEDVAEAFLKASYKKETSGKTYTQRVSRIRMGDRSASPISGVTDVVEEDEARAGYAQRLRSGEGETHPKLERRRVYELGGPSIYTFKELMGYLLKTIKRKRFLLPIPFPLAKAMATFTQFLPTPPLTPDQVELLKQDNVVDDHALKAEDLGVFPQALEVLAPLYLNRYCPGGKN